MFGDVVVCPDLLPIVRIRNLDNPNIAAARTDQFSQDVLGPHRAFIFRLLE